MLAIKVAGLLILMIAVLALTIRAKRFDYERFRTVHGRRKYRVPAKTSRTSTSTSSDEDSNEPS